MALIFRANVFHWLSPSGLFISHLSQGCRPWLPYSCSPFLCFFADVDDDDYGYAQGCIFRLTCSYPELTKDHVLTSAYVNIFRTVTRNALNKSVWRKKDCFWLPLNKHTMNIFIQISNSPRTKARFSENQSAPRLENRKTSPCIPCAPNLLHVLVSRILGYHSLCSPGYAYAFTYYGDHYLHHDCTIHAPSFLCFFIFCGGQAWNVSNCIFYSWRPQMITTTRSEHIQIILSKKCGAMKWHVCNSFFGE